MSYYIIITVLLIVFSVYVLIITPHYYVLLEGKDKTRKFRIYNGKCIISIGSEKFELKKNSNTWILNSKQDILDYQKFKLGDYDAKIVRESIVDKSAIKVVGLFVSFVILIPVYAIFFDLPLVKYDTEVKEDIVSEKTGQDISQNEHKNEIDEKGISVILGDVYKTANTAVSDIVQISENTVWIGENNHKYQAEKLIGKNIYTKYVTDAGVTCYFQGQYSKDYKWDKECIICAYKDGELYYLTRDYYDNGTLKKYERYSQYKDKWLLTNKIKQSDGSTYGDTWSFTYIDIAEKKHTSELVNDEDMYELDEVRLILNDKLLAHFKGMYNEHQEWDDDSGKAFSIKYDNGKIVEVFKGVFIKSHYAEGIRIKIDGDVYTIEEGRFRDEEGNVVQGGITSKTISRFDLYQYINGEEYEQEIVERL